MPKPNRRKRHLVRRIKERVSSVIPIKEIEGNLDREKIMFAKKLTNSRSLGYIIVNDIPIKLIYSKVSKNVITVLEIHNDFEFPKNDYIFHHIMGSGNAYRIRIYPDAYLETDNSKVLTIFEILDSGIWREKKKIGPVFDEVFKIAWDYYNETKKISTTVQ